MAKRARSSSATFPAIASAYAGTPASRRWTWSAGNWFDALPLMRLFVALDIDSEIRRRIATLIEGMRGFAPEAHWVRADSLHLTLKFIGESQKVEAIRESLSAIRSPSVELTFRGAGFFPTARAARVFWVGIESDERLAALARSIDDTLVPLGIGKETHAFTPHITLARSGSGGPSRKGSDRKDLIFSGLRKHLDTMSQPDLGTMTAHEF